MMDLRYSFKEVAYWSLTDGFYPAQEYFGCVNQFLFNLIYFIYLWLRWVFVAVCGLSPVV